MPSRKRIKRKRVTRPRRTLLKIRAVPLERMPKSRFFALIKQACTTGIVPSSIRITTLNWDHAQGRRYMEGEVLSAKDRDELQNCADFLFGPPTKHDVRVERPDR